MPPVYSVRGVSLESFVNIDTFARLYLEKPNRDINSNAQRSSRLLELVYGELGESDPLARTDFLVDAVE